MVLRDETSSGWESQQEESSDSEWDVETAAELPQLAAPLPIDRAAIDTTSSQADESQPRAAPTRYWRWNSKYNDYIQERGGHVLMYTKYQKSASNSKRRTTTGSLNSQPDGQDTSTISRKRNVPETDGQNRKSTRNELARADYDRYPAESSDIHSTPPKINLLSKTSPPPLPLSPLEPHENPRGHGFGVPTDPRRFYQPGKIFKTVWFEPEGSHNQTSRADLEWTASCPPFYDQKPSAKFRWFVVVRRRLHHSLCFPITSYGGKWATNGNKGRPRDFVVLYPAAIEPPEPYPEEDIVRKPIGIIIEKDEEYISPTARLDCGRIYTIEDTVSVMKIGRVQQASLDKLEAYYLESVR